MDLDLEMEVDVALLHRLFHNRNSAFGHTTEESGSSLPPDHRSAAPGIELTA